MPLNLVGMISCLDRITDYSNPFAVFTGNGYTLNDDNILSIQSAGQRVQS